MDLSRDRRRELAQHSAGNDSSGREWSDERLELLLALLVLAAGGSGWGMFSALMRVPLWAVGISAIILGALVGLRLAAELWKKHRAVRARSGSALAASQYPEEPSTVPDEGVQRPNIRIRIRCRSCG